MVHVEIRLCELEREEEGERSGDLLEGPFVITNIVFELKKRGDGTVTWVPWSL